MSSDSDLRSITREPFKLVTFLPIPFYKYEKTHDRFPTELSLSIFFFGNFTLVF